MTTKLPLMMTVIQTWELTQNSWQTHWKLRSKPKSCNAFTETSKWFLNSVDKSPWLPEFSPWSTYISSQPQITILKRCTWAGRQGCITKFTFHFPCEKQGIPYYCNLFLNISARIWWVVENILWCPQICHSEIDWICEVGHWMDKLLFISTDLLSWSIWAAITEHHRLNGL